MAEGVRFSGDSVQLFVSWDQSECDSSPYESTNELIIDEYDGTAGSPLAFRLTGTTSCAGDVFYLDAAFRGTLPEATFIAPN